MQNKGIKEKLQKLGYFASDSIALQVELALTTKPLAGAILHGGAGTGKTFLTECIAKIQKSQYNFFQCFAGTREDDLLIKMLPSESTVSGIALHDGVISSTIKTLQSGKRATLVLDEWDKTRPSADAFLLDFLQNGRINYNGHSSQLTSAQLGKLTVFLTMNDEREVSEPLLRRLSRIDIPTLPTAVVEKALLRTHDTSPYLDAALLLYRRTVAAGLSKPATIQELRQLLDAVQVAAGRADWDSLVFQFVTKTQENHLRLSQVEGYVPAIKSENRAKIRVEDYQPEPEAQPELQEQEQVAAAMPLPRVRNYTAQAFTAKAKESEEITIPETATGILELTDEAYTAFASLAQTPAATPDVLTGWGRVVGKTICLEKPLTWAEYKGNYPKLKGTKGEVMVLEPNVTIDETMRLAKYGAKIVEFSATQIVGYADGLEFKLDVQTKELVLVCDLEKIEKTNTSVLGMDDNWGHYAFSKGTTERRNKAATVDNSFANNITTYRRPNRWRQMKEGYTINFYNLVEVQIVKIENSMSSDGRFYSTFTIQLSIIKEEGIIFHLGDLAFDDSKKCFFPTESLSENSSYMSILNLSLGKKRSSGYKIVSTISYKENYINFANNLANLIAHNILYVRKRRAMRLASEQSLLEA